MPTVSVIIPTYNRAALLPAAVRSVVAQTFPRVEVIVVDDGSTDDTETALSPLLDHITYHRIEHGGRSRARNAGFALATGDYVSFHDSDDLLLPTKVAAQVELLESRPDLGFAYCEYGFVDAAGRAVSPPSPYERVTLAEGEILGRLLEFDFIPLPTLLLRRACLEGHIPFEPSLEPCEDYDLVLRLAREHAAGLVREKGFLITLHEGNTPTDAMRRATIAVRLHHLRDPATRAALGGQWREVFGRTYTSAADYRYNLGEPALALYARALRTGGAPRRVWLQMARSAVRAALRPLTRNQG